MTIACVIRYQRLMAIALVGVAPLSAQTSQSDPTAVRLDTAAILASAKPEIAAANGAWLPSVRRRDAASIASVYTDSGLFVASDGTVIRGRAAVAGMYIARFARMPEVRSGALVQEGVAVAGPALVYEWGHGWLETGSSDGTVTRSASSYLTVWQRSSDGHWRIVRNLTL